MSPIDSFCAALERCHLVDLTHLCAGGFTSLLAKAELEGRIKGVSTCIRAPILLNLMFVDDLLFFCRAIHGEVAVINAIL